MERSIKSDDENGSKTNKPLGEVELKEVVLKEESERDEDDTETESEEESAEEVVYRSHMRKGPALITIPSPTQIFGKKSKPDHPTYEVMVNCALESLSESKGSSMAAIKKYILSNYSDIGQDRMRVYIMRYLKKATTDGFIKQTKGTGGNGSFKLTKKWHESFGKKRPFPMKIQPKETADKAEKRDSKEKEKPKGASTGAVPKRKPAKSATTSAKASKPTVSGPTSSQKSAIAEDREEGAKKPAGRPRNAALVKVPPKPATATVDNEASGTSVSKAAITAAKDGVSKPRGKTRAAASGMTAVAAEAVVAVAAKAKSTSKKKQ